MCLFGPSQRSSHCLWDPTMLPSTTGHSKCSIKLHQCFWEPASFQSVQGKICSVRCSRLKKINFGKLKLILMLASDFFKQNQTSKRDNSKVFFYKYHSSQKSVAFYILILFVCKCTAKLCKIKCIPEKEHNSNFDLLFSN